MSKKDNTSPLFTQKPFFLKSGRYWFIVTDQKFKSGDIVKITRKSGQIAIVQLQQQVMFPRSFDKKYWTFVNLEDTDNVKEFGIRIKNTWIGIVVKPLISKMK